MAFGLFSFEVCDEGLKEEYSMNKIFSAEYDFSCVQQIARADRFACVLMRAIARVKRKGLVQAHSIVQNI